METLRERHETVRIKTIENIKPRNNYVLCKRLEDHFKEKDGLIKATEVYNRDQYTTQNTERVFEVVKLPDKVKDESMFWDTRIEVEVGDKVIVDYFDSMNAMVIITDDGQEYRMILYYGLIVAIRGRKIHPLNGYVLFSPVFVKINTPLHLSAKSLSIVDYRYGLIEHTGYPNASYNKGEKKNLDKDINVKRGDKVVFLNEFKRFAPILEDPVHQTLNKATKKKLFFCHRYHIGGIVVS